MAAEEPPAPPVLFGLVATFLLASAVRTGDALLPPRARLLPFTAVMLLLGLAVGAVAQAAPPVAYMTDGVAALEGLSPAVIFSVLLPALIFPGAMAVEWHVFRRVAGHALLLATLGTAVNAALIALVARYVLPYDWSWAGAWLFGAILSATDPGAGGGRGRWVPFGGGCAREFEMH
jgi:NhaP-type Na+/H+ or K+/H+ antiporter